MKINSSNNDSQSNGANQNLKVEIPSGETIKIHRDPVVLIPASTVEENKVIEESGFTRTVNIASPIGSDGVVRMRDHNKEWPCINVEESAYFFEEREEEPQHNLPITYGNRVMNPGFYASDVPGPKEEVLELPMKKQSVDVHAVDFHQGGTERISAIPIAPRAENFWVVNPQQENLVVVELEHPLESLHMIRPEERPIYVIESALRRPMNLDSPEWHMFREPPKNGRVPCEEAKLVDFIRYEIEECVVEQAWRLPSSAAEYDRVAFAACYSNQMVDMLNCLYQGYRAGSGLPPYPRELTKPNKKLIKELSYPETIATATFGLGDDILLVLADTPNGVITWMHCFISEELVYSSQHKLEKNSVTKTWIINSEMEALPGKKTPAFETPVDAYFVDQYSWVVDRAHGSIPERFTYITGMHLLRIPRRFMGVTTLAIAVKGTIDGVHFIRTGDQLVEMGRAVSIGMTYNETGGYEQYLMMNGCSESLCSRIMGRMAYVIHKLLNGSSVYACKNCFFIVKYKEDEYVLQPPVFNEVNWILNGYPGLIICKELKTIWFC